MHNYMQWNFVCIQNLEVIHKRVQRALIILRDSKKRVQIMLHVRVILIYIIKILLQPHAKPVSWKGARRFVERRLAPTANRGGRLLPSAVHYSLRFGTFVPVQESPSQSCAMPTIINIAYKTICEYS